MKKLLLIFFLFFVGKSFSQTNLTLQFSHDAAGNQVLREFPIDQDEVRPAPLPIYKRNTKAYPSPMQDDLHLEWLLEDEEVDLVQVKTYNMQGRLIHHEKAIDYDEAKISLNFRNHPQGIYIVKFYFNDKTTETIKVQKQ